MPATRYKLASVGSSLGMGATGAFLVNVVGVAKGNATNPLVVARELICNALARVLLLPTPPGFIIELDTGPHFVSLDFNIAGEGLPPINPPDVYAAKPHVCAGIVAFDSWVRNGDRHTQNLAFDADSQRLSMFDHSHVSLDDGAPGMALDIGGHCLVPVLASAADLIQWANFIRTIPDRYISELVASTVSVGLPEANAANLVQFLIDRRNNLEGLLRHNAGMFAAIPADSWPA